MLPQVIMSRGGPHAQNTDSTLILTGGLKFSSSLTQMDHVIHLVGLAIAHTVLSPGRYP